MDVEAYFFPQLDSTNLYCKKHWTEFGPFALVRAGHQTAGKGRVERIWNDVPGESLLLTLCVKASPMPSVAWLSLSPAIALAKTLSADGVKDIGLKWPNDVLIGESKVAGILLEGSYPEYVAIGVGVNVNMTSFPPCRLKATSLRLELGQKVDVEEFYARYTDEWLRFFEGASLKELLQQYRRFDVLEGKTITLSLGEEEVRGTCLGVDGEYRLRLDTDQGVRGFASGEVTHVFR